MLRRVAFQGEPGAYSQEAATAFFGAGTDTLACRTFHDVGDAVASGAAPWGVLPVENSIAGAVVASYDVLASSALTVVGEVVVAIHHCLLGLPGTDPDRIARILSHPVALAQCTRFLQARPGTEAVAVYDTAGAARDVAASGDRSLAAIASRDAAARYGLTVLAPDIEDRHDNQTRFLIVSRGDDAADTIPSRAPAASAARKSILLVETDNAPGALVGVLHPLAAAGIGLSHLATRPATEPWNYRFFIEVECRTGQEPLQHAIEEAGRNARTLRVLGTFPPAA